MPAAHDDAQSSEHHVDRRHGDPDFDQPGSCVAGLPRRPVQFESMTAPPVGGGHMAYHEQLGGVPKPGTFSVSEPVIPNGERTEWRCAIDESGFRSNASATPTSGRPMIALGDSFTFGDEVNDGETWPAALEKLLHVPVINAGVSAYGVDQAALRGELLLQRYHPTVVMLAFISDDIGRTEFSYYPWGRGWKPYFDLANGTLTLRNTPIPTKPPPQESDRLRLRSRLQLSGELCLPSRCSAVVGWRSVGRAAGPPGWRQCRC